VADPKQDSLYVSCSAYRVAGFGRLFVSAYFDMARALANGTDLDANDSNHDQIL
jgi:hypothetical protein